jgi:monoamine oxidase
MRIPKHHDLTLHLCDYFGLELAPFPEKHRNSWVYVNGERCRRWEYLAKGSGRFGAPYAHSAVPANRTADDMLAGPFAMLKKGLDFKPADLFTDERLMRRLDRFSLGEYLHRFLDAGDNPVTGQRIPETMRLTHAALDLIGFEHGASDFRASLLEALRDHHTLTGAKKQIIGGMDLLPKSFVEGRRTLPSRINLTDDIRFHARVKEIRFGSGQYQIAYENSVTRAQCGTEGADFVVLAAPFSALTHVRFGDKVLDEARLRAIRNLHYENATKIVLEFAERFWEKGDQGIRGGRSFTDLPARWIHYPSPRQSPRASSRGLLLASYTWGDDSLRWGSLRPEDRIRFALRDVAEVHRIDERTCERLLVSGMSHSWAEDEYTFGAFAIFEPHQEADLFESIWKPYRKVHFAGEHTSLRHAWIEGAVESGIRAAREVYSEAAAGSQSSRRR